MSVLIKDPVDGVLRLASEQITKNATDINSLKSYDVELNTRISELEQGSVIGGANLVRFALERSGDVFYRVNTYTLPDGFTIDVGDYFELSSSEIDDIPAYGYGMANNELNIVFTGDFEQQTTGLPATLTLINSTQGTISTITITDYMSFYGTSLRELDAQTNKGMIVRVLDDIERGNISAQYVSFDLNADDIWSWVYIGAAGSNGSNGYSLWTAGSDDGLTSAVENMRVGDTVMLAADGIDKSKYDMPSGTISATQNYTRGDLYTLDSKPTTLVTAYTWTWGGNILGPIGYTGATGETGLTALECMTVVIDETSDTLLPTILTLNLQYFNRTPEVGETILVAGRNSNTSKSYLANYKITSYDSTLQSAECEYLNSVETTGIQGETGEQGESSAYPLIVHDGIYSTTSVPLFSTTEVGDAYVVIETGTTASYQLYFHGYGGTSYTVVDGWNGTAGPTPELTFTSTSIGSGENSYATYTKTSDASYTINLYLAAGADGLSPSTGDYATTEQLTETNTAVLSNTNAISGIDTRVSANESEITNLGGSVQTINQDILDIEDDITTLTTNVSTNTSDIETVETTLNSRKISKYLDTPGWYRAVNLGNNSRAQNGLVSINSSWYNSAPSGVTLLVGKRTSTSNQLKPLLINGVVFTAARIVYIAGSGYFIDIYYNDDLANPVYVWMDSSENLGVAGDLAMVSEDEAHTVFVEVDLTDTSLYPATVGDIPDIVTLYSHSINFKGVITTGTYGAVSLNLILPSSTALTDSTFLSLLNDYGYTSAETALNCSGSYYNGTDTFNLYACYVGTTGSYKYLACLYLNGDEESVIGFNPTITYTIYDKVTKLN